MLSRLGELLRTTFGQALVGAVLLWAALPLPCWLSHVLGPISPNVDTRQYEEDQHPLPGPWYASTAWLAWIGPAWWVMLARRRELPGRRPYVALWLVGFLFWLVELYWLTLPYWATSLGWLAVSFYLGFYLPVFVGLTRVAVHGLRVPVILAAPVVWTGLELARGHLLTGVTTASLGHTQYRWLELIQLSDLAGAYGVSFVVMLVAACSARMVPLEGPLSLWERVRVRGALDEAEARPHPDPLPKGEGDRWCFWPLAPGLAVVGAALVYGHFRRADASAAGDRPGPTIRVALIQGSIDTEFKSDPDMKEMVHEQYRSLSEEAVHGDRPVDVVVWPETMFRESVLILGETIPVPEKWKYGEAAYRQWLQEELEEQSDNHPREEIAKMVEPWKVPLILGLDAHRIERDHAQHFNSAQHVDRSGRLVARYDKMHPVMFGEYIPFGDWFPWIYRLTPLPGGLTAGETAVAFDVGGLRLAPNICYESILPHVIRRPVNMLAEGGREPDVLVNLTNDGWFWGSAELDLHLICGVFRAVECRKPFLIAANTGFSASIDGDGRIVALGPRRATGTVVAEVRRDPRRSWYLRHGDWPAGACLAVCVVLAAAGWWRSRKWPCGFPREVSVTSL